MSAQNGALVLIKAGNGGSPEVFTTIGGLRTSHMLLNNQVMNATNVESGAWQQLLGGAGVHSMHVSGGGLFTNSAAEEMVRGYAFGGSVNNYQFIFANGSKVSGAFMIVSYQRSGNHDSEEMFSLALESAGSLTFSA